MASYPIVESSRFFGTPVELYMFIYGENPGSFFAYTNAEEPVTWEGVTYQPIPIDRDKLVSKGTLDNSLVNISMPKTTRLAELYRVYPPSRVTNVFIRQGHILDDGTTEFLVCYTGRVINVERAGNEAKVGCESIQTSMRRTGLRRHYQYGCPHVLYGPQCRAARTNYPFEVLLIDKTVVTFTEDLTAAPGRTLSNFTNGVIGHVGPDNRDERTILRVLAPNTILISGPLPGMVPGSVVELAIGCNHEINDCELTHNNSNNYGGQLWIPFDVPFGKNPF